MSDTGAGRLRTVLWGWPALRGWQGVVGLLVLHWLLLFLSSADKSITCDEVRHLAGGYAALTRAEHRISPASGLMSQLVGALPGLGTVRFDPERTMPNWNRQRSERISEKFLFGSGHDGKSILRQGRAAVAILSVLLGLTLYLCSRRLFGAGGGLLTLGLFTVSPSFLAHGKLVTADVVGVLFFLWGSLAIWTVLHRLTPRTLTLSCLAMAGAALAKMSVPTLVLVVLILTVLRLFLGRPLTVTLGLTLGRATTIETRGRQLAVFVGLIVIHVLVAGALIWAVHGFKYHAACAGSPTDVMIDYTWQELTARPGLAPAAIEFFREYRILPEGYLFGLADTFKHMVDRGAFMMGEYSQRGWWWFFPLVILIKTPVGLLLLFAVGLLALRRKGFYDRLPLLVFLAVFGLVSVFSNLNIGHRHILPIYAPLLILTGGAWAFSRHRAWRIGVLSAVATVVIGSLLTFPHYISYFNFTIGGPSQGFRYVIDSSVDWGQDLGLMRRWIDERRDRGDRRPLHLAYFGTVSPTCEGFSKTELIGSWRRSSDPPMWFRGGYFAISATILQTIYTQYSGRWTPKHDGIWKMVQDSLAPHRGEDAAATWAAMEKAVGRTQMLNTLRGYRLFRLLRLCAYLRQREPDDFAGYSIMIYELSDDEVRAALHGPIRSGS